VVFLSPSTRIPKYYMYFNITEIVMSGSQFEVSGLNLNTECFFFIVFLISSRVNTWIEHKVSIKPLPSEHYPIHHYQFLLPFDSM
jgi:hypothetical protein